MNSVIQTQTRCLSKALVSFVFFLCLAPFLFNLFAFEFTSNAIKLSADKIAASGVVVDDLFYAFRRVSHHALLEWSAVSIALLTVLPSFAYYKKTGYILAPIIGVALLCSGIMDAFHTMAALRLIDANAPNTDLIPFTWGLSRTFNAVILIVGVATFQMVKKKERNIGWSQIGIISAIFIGIAYALISFCTNSPNLPRTTFSDTFFTHPYDVSSLALFILAGILFWRLYKETPSLLTGALLLSIIPQIITQLHMAFGSTALFDSHFNIAHFLKIIAYLIPFIGLVLDYIYTKKIAAPAPSPSMKELPNFLTYPVKIGNTAIPLFSLFLTAGICILPITLNLLGTDFASITTKLTAGKIALSGVVAEDLFYALTGAAHHALLEWSAVSIAFAYVLLSFIYFKAKGDVSVPIIGMALLCSGIMDAFHTMAALRLIDANAPNSDLIPFTWALSRGFDATILMIGATIALILPNSTAQKGFRQVVFTSFGFITISYFLIHISAINPDLPKTTFPDAFFTRPYDVLPLVLFIMAAVVFWKYNQRKRSLLSMALLLSLLPQITTQLHMAFGSTALFDNHFNIAHFLKIIAYLVPFIGLVLEYASIASTNQKKEKEKEKEKYTGWLVNSKIRTKFILLTSVPVFGLIYLSSLIVTNSIKVATEAKQLEKTATLFVHMGNLVHEQQKERGASSVFLGSNGTKFKSELAWQRTETDKKREIFLRYAKQFRKSEGNIGFSTKLAVLLENLDRLDTIRNNIDILSITTKKSIEYFTHQNALNFELISYTATIVSDPRAIISIIAYVSYLKEKELSGIERALGASVFSSGKLSSEVRSKFTATLADQKAYGETFRFTATDKKKALYHTIMTASSAKEVQRMRNILLHAPKKIREISGKYWFDTITQKIELLKKEQALLEKSLLELVTRREQVASYEMAVVIMLSLMILATTLFMAVFFSRLITQPLTQIKKGIFLYENTENPAYLPLELKEEIGSLARSFHGMLTIVRNRTVELETSKEKLVSSEKRLSATFNTVLDGIITIDSKGKILAINKAVTTLFGYKEEELLEENIRMLTPEPHRANHDQYLRNYLETGERKIIGVGGRELQGVRKDGSMFNLELGINEVRLDTEILFVGTLRDITERKKAEVELARMVDNLTDSNEELERFAYVCSHDLQEPLRMIRSFSEKLEGHFKDHLKKDEKGTRYLNFVTDGAERAQNLIADILSYSSINRETKKAEAVDLNELIELIKTNFHTMMEESGATITYSTLPTVTANRTQLYQLMQNLINNGFKYSRSGITPCVNISATYNETHWKIAIKDNGIGMEERHLKKIFDVFQRLHRKEEYQGTGVGLSICKKVVERHSGKIWVESEVGKGSTFIFTLLKSTQEEKTDELNPQHKAG